MKNHWWKDRNEQIAQQCINQGVNESVSHSFLDRSAEQVNVLLYTQTMKHYTKVK